MVESYGTACLMSQWFSSLFTCGLISLMVFILPKDDWKHMMQLAFWKHMMQTFDKSGSGQWVGMKPPGNPVYVALSFSTEEKKDMSL